MPTDLNIPLVLMRNLPVSTATVTADYTFVAVAGNRNTVRVPWSTLSAGFITVSPAIPTGPTVTGTEGQIAWDGSGVYTYTNGAWGKSPRLGTNWDDLTNDARFLLVNKIMELSDTELANVLKTLGIGSATQEKAGLVKLATTMDENKGNVPTTAQVVDYVDEQLKEIEIGGGGGDKISAYQGGVDIKGPGGELILTYDATERILCNAPRHLIELRQVSYITCLSANSVQGVCIDSASPLQATSRSPQSTASSSSLAIPSWSILSLASASRCITLARSLAG